MKSNQIKLAKSLSKIHHAHQKYGVEDYFNYHICGVVQSLKQHNLSENYTIVAYLHDIVEDTELTLDSIENLFGKEIRNAIDAITKRETETRDQYLERCSSNKIARIVKLHDALFNSTNCFKNKNNTRFNYYLDTISKLTHR